MPQIKDVQVPRIYPNPVGQSRFTPINSRVILKGGRVIDHDIFGSREVVAEISSGFPNVVFSETIIGTAAPKYEESVEILSTSSPFMFTTPKSYPLLEFIENEKFFFVKNDDNALKYNKKYGVGFDAPVLTKSNGNQTGFFRDKISVFRNYLRTFLGETVLENKVVVTGFVFRQKISNEVSYNIFDDVEQKINDILGKDDDTRNNVFLYFANNPDGNISSLLDELLTGSFITSQEKQALEDSIIALFDVEVVHRWQYLNYYLNNAYISNVEDIPGKFYAIQDKYGYTASTEAEKINFPYLFTAIKLSIRSVRSSYAIDNFSLRYEFSDDIKSTIIGGVTSSSFQDFYNKIRLKVSSLPFPVTIKDITSSQNKTDKEVFFGGDDVRSYINYPLLLECIGSSGEKVYIAYWYEYGIKTNARLYVWHNSGGVINEHKFRFTNYENIDALDSNYVNIFPIDDAGNDIDELPQTIYGNEYRFLLTQKTNEFIDVLRTDEEFFLYSCRLFSFLSDIARVCSILYYTDVKDQANVDYSGFISSLDFIQNNDLESFCNNLSQIDLRIKGSEIDITEADIKFNQKHDSSSINILANIDNKDPYSYGEVFTCFANMFNTTEFYSIFEQLNKDISSSEYPFNYKSNAAVSTILGLKSNKGYVDFLSFVVNNYNIFCNLLTNIFPLPYKEIKVTEYNISFDEIRVLIKRFFLNSFSISEFRTASKILAPSANSAFRKYISYDNEEVINSLTTVENRLIVSTNKAIYMFTGNTYQTIEQHKVCKYGSASAGSGLVGNHFLFVSEDNKHLYAINHLEMDRSGVSLFVKDAVPFFLEDFATGIKRFVSAGDNGFVLLNTNDLYVISTDGETFFLSKFKIEGCDVIDMLIVEKPDTNIKNNSEIEKGILFIVKQNNDIFFCYYTDRHNIYYDRHNYLTSENNEGIEGSLYDVYIKTLDFDKALPDKNVLIRSIWSGGYKLKDGELLKSSKNGDVVLHPKMKTIDDQDDFSMSYSTLTLAGSDMEKNIKIKNRSPSNFIISHIIYNCSINK